MNSMVLICFQGLLHHIVSRQPMVASFIPVTLPISQDFSPAPTATLFPAQGTARCLALVWLWVKSFHCGQQGSERFCTGLMTFCKVDVLGYRVVQNQGTEMSSGLRIGYCVKQDWRHLLWAFVSLRRGQLGSRRHKVALKYLQCLEEELNWE